MVCGRFTNLFLGLLFSCLALCESTSIAQTESATKIRENQKNIVLESHHLKTEMVGKMKLFTGRKMGIVFNTISKSSGAKCGFEDQKNPECKMGVVAVKLVGRIPFSADYHKPQPHPPKNN